jgi:hypothetical protein
VFSLFNNYGFEQAYPLPQQLLMGMSGATGVAFSSYPMMPPYPPPPVLHDTSLLEQSISRYQQRNLPLQMVGASARPPRASPAAALDQDQDSNAKKKDKKRRNTQMEAPYNNLGPYTTKMIQEQQKHYKACPQRNIDNFIRYPMFYEKQLNAADPLNFTKTFQGLCEEGLVIVGYYADQKGKPIHREAMKHMVGLAEYEQYMQTTFAAMPDILFHAMDISFARTRYELVITCEFTYRGTYVAFAPKPVPVEPVQDLSEIRKVPTTAELVEATEACVLIDDDEGGAYISQEFAPNNTLLSQPLQNMDIDIEDIFAGDLDTDMDWLADLDVDSMFSGVLDSAVNGSTSGIGAMDNVVSSNSAMSVPISQQSSPSKQNDSYHWVPASSSSRQSPTPSQQMEEQEPQQYIIGQFLPTNTKELVMPESSALAVGQLAEVSIRGKCHFYINNETMLIRRIEFSYRQEDDNSV